MIFVLYQEVFGILVNKHQVKTICSEQSYETVNVISLMERTIDCYNLERLVKVGMLFSGSSVIFVEEVSGIFLLLTILMLRKHLKLL